MAHHTPFPLFRHASDPLLWALLFSLALHGATLGFLPGFSFNPSVLSESPLTVELVPPPPPPPPEPEKPKPEPVKPPPQKIEALKPPPPTPQPVVQPVAQPIARAETPPPIAEPPKKETPPAVIAVEQKPAEPAPEAVVAPPTPVSPPAREPDSDAMANARNGYGKLLATEFARHRKYPQVARMRGWQGTVQVSLQIDAEGNASNPTISQSSGKDLLDNQALETVRKALPLPPPPNILRGKPFPIVVPVVFRLENP